MRDQYFRQLEALLPKVIKKLKAKGIKRQHLAFGGEGAVRKPRVPTDAPSEFLANRAMGDWAEQRLATALPAALPEWTVVQYGDTSRITAGAPPFKAHYLAEIEKTRQFGKRPDLLLIPTALVTDPVLCERSHAEPAAGSSTVAGCVDMTQRAINPATLDGEATCPSDLVSRFQVSAPE